MAKKSDSEDDDVEVLPEKGNGDEDNKGTDDDGGVRTAVSHFIWKLK